MVKVLHVNQFFNSRNKIEMTSSLLFRDGGLVVPIHI